MEVKPWEELLSGIISEVPAGTPMRELAEAKGTANLLVIKARCADGERETAEYAPADCGWPHPAASDAEPPSPRTANAPPPP